MFRTFRNLCWALAISLAAPALAQAQMYGPLFVPPAEASVRPEVQRPVPPPTEVPVRRLPPVGGERQPTDPAAGAMWWWEREVVRSAELGQPSLEIDVGWLMSLAMNHSQQVKAFEVTRWIRGEQTTIADAEFDAEFFSDGRFDDTSDPVGNSLTTGGPPRLNEHRASFELGLRRRTQSGGTFSLAQRWGHDNSNSVFFVPNDQGNARLSLEFRQPLLEGHGRSYSQSFVVETVFASEQAEADYLRVLQDRLFEVGAAYWSLYRDRATLLQRRRHVRRALGITEELEQRQILDALRSQVLRAKAAVATRESELAVAEAELQNTQSRIRALVNAPCFQTDPMVDLIPVELPPSNEVLIDLAAHIDQALMCRPEMRALTAQLQAADLRTAQAANESLPTLDLVVESYLNGLEGESRVGQAWQQQFSEGAPSYGLGLEFSAPLGNRAAEARLRQRRFDQTRLHHLLQDQASVVRSEVEIAARNVAAAFRTIQGRRLAVEAVAAEMRYLEERWKRLRGDPNLGQLQLDDLLTAQVRLFDEERALVAAQADYGAAVLELQRAAGALVTSVSGRSDFELQDPFAPEILTIPNSSR